MPKERAPGVGVTVIVVVGLRGVACAQADIPMASDGSMSASEKNLRDMVDRRMAELGPDHMSTLKVRRVSPYFQSELRATRRNHLNHLILTHATRAPP